MRSIPSFLTSANFLSGTCSDLATSISLARRVSLASPPPPSSISMMTEGGVVSLLLPVMKNDNWSTSLSLVSGSLLPVYLSALAGASTCLGAAMVLRMDNGNDTNVSSTTTKQRLPFYLSLAASVMITVSVVSILPECLSGVVDFPHLQIIDELLLQQRVVSFGIGCLLYYGLSKFLIPEPEQILQQHQKEKRKRCTAKKENTLSFLSCSPFHHDKHHAMDKGIEFGPSTLTTLTTTTELEQNQSWRVTMLLFVSLLLHNLPEGVAVSASTYHSQQLGFSVAFGIMVHNIPEGMCIAAPCLAARPNQPWLAFTLASISGLAEPLGAVLALQFLQNQPELSIMSLPPPSSSSSLFTSIVTFFSLSNILAMVAGIMCFVAIDELYPESIRYSRNQHPKNDDNDDDLSILYGSMLGVALMLATELGLSQHY